VKYPYRCIHQQTSIFNAIRISILVISSRRVAKYSTPCIVSIAQVSQTLAILHNKVIAKMRWDGEIMVIVQDQEKTLVRNKKQ
jgi:hypothetical protein